MESTAPRNDGSTRRGEPEAGAQRTTGGRFSAYALKEERYAATESEESRAGRGGIGWREKNRYFSWRVSERGPSRHVDSAYLVVAPRRGRSVALPSFWNRGGVFRERRLPDSRVGEDRHEESVWDSRAPRERSMCRGRGIVA